MTMDVTVTEAIAYDCGFRAGQAHAAGLQTGVDKWMDACFGQTIKADQLERADRFVEEALELAQTMPGFGADRAHALVDYVFGRDVGERPQEVGGVMVTLAALCNAAELDMNACGATELARVWTKVDAIRAKQAAKPTGSALPIATAKGAGK
jgi:NTP pyrophosphatase (non-canonical NTP hydrolase)